jgi:hypothetical protein
MKMLIVVTGNHCVISKVDNFFDLFCFYLALIHFIVVGAVAAAAAAAAAVLVLVLVLVVVVVVVVVVVLVVVAV